MLVRRRVGRSWVLISLVILYACGGDTPAPKVAEDAAPAAAPADSWYSLAEITGDLAKANDSVSVDLYLDSSVSMGGFVGAANSSLPPLIRDLESAAQTGWRAVSVRYFKFGTKVVEAKREDFVKRLETAAFFKEKGISEKTNIDVVLAQSDPSRLTLVLTDLFQTAGDVNAVVSALKDNLVTKNVPVGLLPVLSEFNGMVFDANVPPYSYRSTADPATHRAFYLLMFGNRHDMKRLVDVIGEKTYIDRSRFLLLSPYVTKTQVAALVKPSVSKNLVVRPANDLQGNEFFLDLREGTNASLAVDLNIETVEGAAALKRDRLEMRAVRKTADGETATSDITLGGPLVTDGTNVRLPLNIRLAEQPGTYHYKIDLRTPTLSAFDLPSWVPALSSNNPSPSFEPNKTLNLAPFVQGLVQSTTSVQATTAARMFIRIRKR